MKALFFAIFRHTLGYLLRFRMLYLKCLRLGPHGEPARHLPTEELEIIKDKDSRFKKLLENRTSQTTDASCSAAAVACVINAMGGDKASRVKNQMDLLETIREGRWRERLSPEGWRGRRGLPLSLLGEVVPAALGYHGIRAEVEIFPFYSHETKEIRIKRAEKILNRFSGDSETYLIAHFDQGAFLPVPTIPHISPVGRWHPETMRVTMLDVDPAHPLPYEISLARFVEGIASDYGGLLRPYGYSHGGLVMIR